MSGRMIELDLSDYRRFFERLGAAASGDFKQELAVFIDGMGFEFLRILQDLIIKRKVSLSGQLLASFEKGGEGNVWDLSDDDLTLEVGTNVEYAKWANDGHEKVNPDTPGAFFLPDGRLARFVPGHWIVRGDGKSEFIYSGHAERREREPRHEPAKRSSTASKSKTRNRQSEGGMILTAGKVKGSKFWEDALEVFENVYPGFLEAKLQEWLDTYFADFK